MLCSGCWMVTSVCFLPVPSLCIPAMTSTITVPAYSNFILPQTSLAITGLRTNTRNSAHCSEIVQGHSRHEDGSKKLFFDPECRFMMLSVHCLHKQNSTFDMQVSVGVTSFAEPTGSFFAK